MQQVQHGLAEARGLYEKIVGQPAPPIEPDAFVPFPHGVDPLRYAMQELDDVRRLAHRVSVSPRPVTWMPVADCFASAKAYVVLVDLPGMTREEIEVIVAGGECVIRGERKPALQTEILQPVSIERPYGPFERRFALPADCSPDGITAKLVDGTLEVRLEIDGKRIETEKNVEVE